MDHSQIKVELQETFGSDKSIAEAAWTSSLTYQGKQKRTQQDIERVVKMLADSKHSTPFESVIFRFWIKMPIQTDRQHMTHRIATHNGMSGRYRTMPNDWLEVPDDIINFMSRGIEGDSQPWIDSYNKLCTDTNNFYENLLQYFKVLEKNNDISNKEYKRLREFFRGILPQNNMTERVTIMNLRSFANYQKLRNSEHAQEEIQQVAKLMLEAVEKSNVCPIAIQALKLNNWVI